MLNKQMFIDQLAKLVSFNTLSGDFESNSKALDYVETLISDKANLQRLTNGNAEILIASNSTTDTPQVGYMVHIDVVAGSKELFQMRQEDNKVFGRGVSDMKFSIPIGIALLNESLEKQESPTFSLVITTDEETGGFEGGKFLAEELNFRPKYLLVPDGGDNMNFVNKSKGILQLEISAKGKAAHASRPWLGNNAITPLAKLVVELERVYGENSTKETWETTLNFGQISGGKSTNQVCDLAWLKLDFRYPESTSAKEILAGVMSLAQEIDPTLEIKPLSTGFPTFTDTDQPLIQRFLEVMSKKMQTQIQIKPAFGASDARHFTPFDIPILMIKPNGGAIHSVDEWLDVDSTMQFYQGLREFIFFD